MTSGVKSAKQEVMKTIFKIFIAVTFLLPLGLMAQKGHKHPPHKGNKIVVVNNKHYYKHHHHKHHLFHPVWAPNCSFYRRWVFFPHYNFYWDNYNSMYVYWGGTVWVRTKTPPPMIINININNEKKYELKDTDDVNDDIYDNNDLHKKEYPET